jgi:N-acetylneuraminic acid mutarotase
MHDVGSILLKHTLVRVALVALALLVSALDLFAEDSFNWRELPAIPDAEGFAGPFAGTHNEVLIVAGGANFPDKMPWEGGVKVWYDQIFVLDSPQGSWKEAGKLPRPLGYGVSISTRDGIVCIGGSDANQHYADCFRIQFQDDRLSIVALPSLPKPCANTCGALLDNRIYVAGGLESPTATSTLRTFWSLDLSDPKARWHELEPWPGTARMLATAAVQDKALFLCSGTDLKAGSDGKAIREYLRDAYRYQPGHGWTKIADLPRPAVASPTPAPNLGQSTFLVISGDDGTLVDFKPPEKHPGFPKSVLAYDTQTNRWRIAGDGPVGHVTTTMVGWRGRFVMPSGEIRPGKRSPAVWSLQQSK